MRDLLRDLLFQRLPDRQLTDDDAVELLQIFVQILEERELVALVILRDRHAEPGERIEAPGAQHQHPGIDIAVGDRPVAFGRRLRERLVGRARNGRRRSCVQPQRLHAPSPASARDPTRGAGTTPARCAPVQSRRSR